MEAHGNCGRTRLTCTLEERETGWTGPKKHVGETKGSGLDVLRGIKEQISNQQMQVLPSKIEDRTINNAK